MLRVTQILAIVLLLTGSIFGQSITLESVDGTVGNPVDSALRADGSAFVTFNLRLTNGGTAFGGGGGAGAVALGNAAGAAFQFGLQLGHFPSESFQFSFKLGFVITHRHRSCAGDPA